MGRVWVRWEVCGKGVGEAGGVWGHSTCCLHMHKTYNMCVQYMQVNPSINTHMYMLTCTRTPTPTHPHTHPHMRTMNQVSGNTSLNATIPWIVFLHT